jgi:hypothetical protein
MKKYNCFWNGEPATCSVVNVLIHSVKEPKAHWQNSCAGELHQALIIYQGGFDFMIDNEAGDGWMKVNEGYGSPAYGGRHLGACTVINEASEETIRKTFDAEKFAINDAIFKKWHEKTYPESFKRCEKIRQMSEKLRKQNRG